jgi:hypothetical protein
MVLHMKGPLFFYVHLCILPLGLVDVTSIAHLSGAMHQALQRF